MNKRGMRFAAAAILGVSSLGVLSAPAFASTGGGGGTTDCESYVESITRPTASTLKFAFVVNCSTTHFNLSIGGTVQRGGTVVGTTQNQNTLCGTASYCRRYVTVSDPAGYQSYTTISEGYYTYAPAHIDSIQSWSL